MLYAICMCQKGNLGRYALRSATMVASLGKFARKCVSSGVSDSRKTKKDMESTFVSFRCHNRGASFKNCTWCS